MKIEVPSPTAARDTLYEMDLFNELVHNYVNYLRVPGGWIVTQHMTSQGSVFVPFDTEYQPLNRQA